jgi:2,4-dienoyl-CoA reductase-like NADH-dependent reductase (Old Yellow Enzyme family)
MSKLFDASEINGMRLSNRFVRSATWEGLASDDGACTQRLVDMMAELAAGGVGLIISSHAYVSPEGQAGPWQLGIYHDELIPGLKDMTAAVHANGGKIVMQLAHAGYFAATKLTGQPALAPSNVDGFADGPRREMTIEDIQHTIEAFGVAAKRAKEAGFDGVQIHSAHGYLLSQFLSPAFNKRQDPYGGEIRNRARILIDVLKSIRSAVGADFPVLIKMNCQDFIENGLALDDSLQAATILAQNGIDAIEISGGVLIGGKLSPTRLGIKNEDKEAYFRQETLAIRNRIDVPLILVGGNRSFQVAERLVDENTCDYIALSRPLIREPDLINRWKSGDLEKASCVSDNMCYKPARNGEGLYCLTEKRQTDR